MSLFQSERPLILIFQCQVNYVVLTRRKLYMHVHKKVKTIRTSVPSKKSERLKS